MDLSARKNRLPDEIKTFHPLQPSQRQGMKTTTDNPIAGLHAYHCFAGGVIPLRVKEFSKSLST